MSTQSEELYAEAYDAHYKREDLATAFGMYHEVVATYSDSAEASYANMQIQNIKLKLGSGKRTNLSEQQANEIAQRYVALGPAIAQKRVAIDELKARTRIVIEQQLQERNARWEYLSVVDAQDETLNKLGDEGWEMVNMVSYQTGGGLTINGVGGEKYVVHFRYAFKRQLLRANNQAVQQHLGLIQDAERELNASRPGS